MKFNIDPEEIAALDREFQAWCKAEGLHLSADDARRQLGEWVDLCKQGPIDDEAAREEQESWDRVRTKIHDLRGERRQEFSGLQRVTRERDAVLGRNKALARAYELEKQANVRAWQAVNAQAEQLRLARWAAGLCVVLGGVFALIVRAVAQ